MANNKARILHERIEAANIPIDGVDSSGTVHFKPEATVQQRADAAAIVAAYDQGAEETADTALRNRVRTLAQSAVGVQIDALTNVQVRALIAILLWKAGAIDNAGAIRPLNQWVRNGD